MTNPMELTPAGRDISQAEQDRWLKGAHLPNGFDPAAPISLRARGMLEASNALCQERAPTWWGGHFSPVGETRHWGKK